MTSPVHAVPRTLAEILLDEAHDKAPRTPSDDEEQATEVGAPPEPALVGQAVIAFAPQPQNHFRLRGCEESDEEQEERPPPGHPISYPVSAKAMWSSAHCGSCSRCRQAYKWISIYIISIHLELSIYVYSNLCRSIYQSIINLYHLTYPSVNLYVSGRPGWTQ